MSYAVVVFVLGLLVAIHEYGHLLAAKLCGIPVQSELPDAAANSRS